MTGKYWQRLGLFLMAFAAFSIALGHPHVVLAATDSVEPSGVEKVLGTEQGRATLAEAGLSAEQAKTMLAALSPQQRSALDDMAESITCKAQLGARMMAAGYTKAEVDERLALLSEDEIARLAGDPEATTAGTGAGFVIAVLVVILVAVLVAWYFVAIEEPAIPYAEPAPVPPPAE